jgi:Pg-II fimbriae c
MKKQFFVAAMALVLGAGFTACSSDDLNVTPGTEVNQKATTYMSVSFTLPTANSTRATADDGQDKNDPDFNNVGKWNGQDKIESVDVYVFNGQTATSTLEVTQNYAAADLAFTQKNASNETLVTANKAFKVTAGAKTVYVVVNPTTKSKALLPATKDVTTLQDFEAKYKSDELAFTRTNGYETAHSSTVKTYADELAEVKSNADVIVMTGPGVEQTIDDNVSEQQAVSGVKNRANLEVQRAVARVFVTTKAGFYTVKTNNPETGALDVNVKISDLTYVVAQGENQLYFLQKKQDPANTDGAAFTTPAFNQAPSTADYWTYDFHTSYKNVGAHYDYSGLWKSTATGNSKGLEVTTLGSNGLTDITGNLETALKGEFVLPTLHKYVVKTAANARQTTGYRKGNTAYILVRGYITPDKFVDANGDVKTAADLTATQDLYLGANGVFYANKATVQDATKKGVAGQTAQLYKGRKVLYFVWINPDDLAKAVNSPVIRNNVYHVSIKGISKIGSNWNPLVPNPNVPDNPGQPIDPNDPHNPINDNPNNPDPRPKNDIEPKDPPVDPKDPLTSKETWMSVNVNILPWAVHTIEIEL